jgi:hypothetical protein
MWLQVNMPGDKNFKVSEMSLKRRADGCCGNQQRQINSVSFETSQDGSTWTPHNGGEWYKTGQVWNDNVELERRINIEPPMIGKFFRVVTDKDHKGGPEIQGRFDLWAVETDKTESVVQVQSLISNAVQQKLPTTVSEQDLSTGQSPI